MQITLDEGYNAMCDFVYLGYVGEVNAREISVLNYAIPEATAYKLKVEYPDKTVYELPIKNGICSLGASIFKTACEVKCQIVAYAVEGEVYKLVRKSDIFKQEIRSSIDESGIPSYEESLAALDKILQYESNSKEYAERAEQARDTAVSAKERAVSAENTTVQKADEADKSAQSAKNSEQNAAKSAERAESVAEVATASANQARDYAKEAAKAATNAGLSADTAMQAASRAETAQASAETSAAQADTAMQGAETARAEAVTSQNNAKISAAQASTSAQQTEADKTITAGYAKTAKTNADSTAADRQAVQEMAKQVTADKATVAENATKVAEDRTAAETAAQTAQAVADSLPEDYTTAVEKIAENTAEIGHVKLTDKELQRRVNALYDLGNGITHQFETDSETAYAKTVPTGAKLMSVKNIGGRSIVWNQLYYKYGGSTLNCKPIFKSHKYLLRVDYSVSENTKVYLYFRDAKYTAETNRQITKDVAAGSGKISWITSPLGEHSDGGEFGAFRILTDADGNNKYDKSPFSNHEIFDLTTMFGSGNEPSTVEEFEKMFPADYYPYNAGEIVSAGMEEVVEQGANLCDPTIFAATYPDCISVKDDIIDIISGKTAMFESGVALKIPQGYRMTVIPVPKENGAINGRIRVLFSDGNIRDIYITDINGLPKSATNYVVEKDISAIAFNWSTIEGGYSFKMQITRNATDSFTPYHSTAHKIPEAIKALPGYGVEGNIVDYENKTYTQVNSVSGTEIVPLATPIVTDISNLIDDDFLRNIEVEAEGTITFKNSNGDDYRIPVPNEEEYIVKLSEVGGTT